MNGQLFSLISVFKLSFFKILADGHFEFFCKFEKGNSKNLICYILLFCDPDPNQERHIIFHFNLYECKNYYFDETMCKF